MTQTGPYVILTKEMPEFAASHNLPNHKAGCYNLHGHNYGCKVSVIGRVHTDTNNPVSGMIVDFTTIKDLYKQLIHERLDHAHLFAQNLPGWYQMFIEAYISHAARVATPVTRDEAKSSVDKLLGKVAHLEIPETTAEWLAWWIFKELDDAIHRVYGGKVEIEIYSVEVFETPTSSALYIGTRHQSLNTRAVASEVAARA